MRLYVASSWRNNLQPHVVNVLRVEGHEVYDFRNPAPGNHGFSWASIDEAWQAWSVEAYARALRHPIAQGGFDLDFGAMRWADGCVLVLPSGRSAHVEFGWMLGAGKPGVVLMAGRDEPELMYLLAGAAPIAPDLPSLIRWANTGGSPC